jgi:hypothetical protein
VALIIMEIAMIAFVWYLMCTESSRTPNYVWKDWDERNLKREWILFSTELCWRFKLRRGTFKILYLALKKFKRIWTRKRYSYETPTPLRRLLRHTWIDQACKYPDRSSIKHLRILRLLIQIFEKPIRVGTAAILPDAWRCPQLLALTPLQEILRKDARLINIFSTRVICLKSQSTISTSYQPSPLQLAAMSVSTIDLVDASALCTHNTSVRENFYSVFGTKGCSLYCNEREAATKSRVEQRRPPRPIRRNNKKDAWNAFKATSEQFFDLAQLDASINKGCGSCKVLKAIIKLVFPLCGPPGSNSAAEVRYTFSSSFEVTRVQGSGATMKTQKRGLFNPQGEPVDYWYQHGSWALLTEYRLCGLLSGGTNVEFPARWHKFWCIH